MKETTLYRQVKRIVEENGGLAIKLHDVSTGGLPDMLIVHRNVTVFIETKVNRRVTPRIGPLLTKLQQVTCLRLATGHAPVAILAWHERPKHYCAYRVTELDSPAVVSHDILVLLDEFVARTRQGG